MTALAEQRHDPRDTHQRNQGRSDGVAQPSHNRPILPSLSGKLTSLSKDSSYEVTKRVWHDDFHASLRQQEGLMAASAQLSEQQGACVERSRSEERRVGKESRARWTAE